MSELKALHVLIAPQGQLSGNGQLRETVKERRSRKGESLLFWYLSPDLAKQFELPGTNIEAVVAEELTAINWLKLRFGGESTTVQLDIAKLQKLATDLPPGPITRDISVK